MKQRAVQALIRFTHIIAMKDAIKCCISCILPCGALDVIRIVHSNGYVEEIRGSIRAAEIMKAYPKHVLKKSSSCSSMDVNNHGAIPRIVMVPAEAELQRGKIYFLTPVAAKPTPRSPDHKGKSRTKKKIIEGEQLQAWRKNSTRDDHTHAHEKENAMLSDQYLREILKEKVSTQRERLRGRVGVWRPDLGSITEAVSEPTSENDS